MPRQYRMMLPAAEPRGPHGMPLLARPVDEVPDEQDVGGEAGLLDDVQLVAQALLDARPSARRRSVAAAPSSHVRARNSLRRLALRDDVVQRREAQAAELELAGRTARRWPRVLRSASGTCAEQLPHLLGRLQIECARRLHAHALGVLVGAVGLHAQQHVLGARLPLAACSAMSLVATSGMPSCLLQLEQPAR